MRAESARSVARILREDISAWPSLEKACFENFAVTFALVNDLSSWTREEKDALVELIRAKTARDEMRYLHLTQRHERLRQALLKMGS
jgi:hypothetical protein